MAAKKKGASRRKKVCRPKTASELLNRRKAQIKARSKRRIARIGACTTEKASKVLGARGGRKTAKRPAAARKAAAKKAAATRKRNAAKKNGVRRNPIGESSMKQLTAGSANALGASRGKRRPGRKAPKRGRKNFAPRTSNASIVSDWYGL